jgi:hypothetical protein
MRKGIAFGQLIILSTVAATIASPSNALAARPHQPVAASGGIGIRLADAPADTRNNPLARSYIVSRAAPGTRIHRRIEIINSTRLTADVALYTAAAGRRRGRFAFAPGRSRNELSSWTSVSQSVMHMRPGANAFETVTINVPKRASLGERYAVVWAEVSAPAPKAGGVTLVNRVGIRMYFSIGPGGAPPANFVIGSLTAQRSATGEPLVVATIRNSGKRTLDIAGSLTLSAGPGGLRAGPFPVELGTALGPGSSETASVRLDKRLPIGPWRARLQLRSGFIQRETTTTIEFPSVLGVASPSNSRHPLLVIGTLLALLLAVAAVAARRGRGGLKRDHRLVR